MPSPQGETTNTTQPEAPIDMEMWGYTPSLDTSRDFTPHGDKLYTVKPVFKTT